MFKFTTWTFPLSSLFSVFCSVTEGRTLLSFLQMLSPLRTRGNGFRLKEGGLDWIKGKSYLWEGQCSSGTGCPEMRWVPRPCRHSGQAGGLWALMELWVSLHAAGGWARWPLRVLSNSSHSMMRVILRMTSIHLYIICAAEDSSCLLNRMRPPLGISWLGKHLWSHS